MPGVRPLRPDPALLAQRLSGRCCECPGFAARRVPGWDAMSLQGAVGAEELIFYVNGRKVSVVRRESGERATAVLKVAPKVVGTDRI